MVPGKKGCSCTFGDKARHDEVCSLGIGSYKMDDLVTDVMSYIQLLPKMYVSRKCGKKRDQV